MGKCQWEQMGLEQKIPFCFSLCWKHNPQGWETHPELATDHPNPPNPIIGQGKAVRGSRRQSMLTAPTTLLLTGDLGNVS